MDDHDVNLSPWSLVARSKDTIAKEMSSALAVGIPVRPKAIPSLFIHDSFGSKEYV